MEVVDPLLNEVSSMTEHVLIVQTMLPLYHTPSVRLFLINTGASVAGFLVSSSQQCSTEVDRNGK